MGRSWIDIAKLVGCVALPLLVGLMGSLATRTSVGVWYAELRKPELTPPGWVFAPVWTLLYVMMGVAAYLVLRAGLGQAEARLALLAYLVQLSLNLLWAVLFFGLRMPLWGLVDIVVLWAMILLTTILFLRVSRPAGWLMAPYLAWVTFASYLNAAILWLNR